MPLSLSFSFVLVEMNERMPLRVVRGMYYIILLQYKRLEMGFFLSLSLGLRFNFLFLFFAPNISSFFSFHHKIQLTILLL